MAKRKIIKIDEAKCNGCGLCIPNCPEGALQLIDGKARMISDLCCDGLGACIGHCPQAAISIEERESGDYDEKRVMENIVKQGKNVIKAHLKHLKEHNQQDYLKQALDFLKQKNIEVSVDVCSHMSLSSPCPGTKVMDFRSDKQPVAENKTGSKNASELRQWPIQITLVPLQAPYLKDADLLIAADCVAFSYADFHQEFLKGRVLLVGCPKLDDANFYEEKITQILKENNIKSITCVHMEVPCCFGMVNIIKSAIAATGKVIAFTEVAISIKGEKLV